MFYWTRARTKFHTGSIFRQNFHEYCGEELNTEFYIQNIKEMWETAELTISISINEYRQVCNIFCRPVFQTFDRYFKDVILFAGYVNIGSLDGQERG